MLGADTAPSLDTGFTSESTLVTSDFVENASRTDGLAYKDAAKPPRDDRQPFGDGLAYKSPEINDLTSESTAMVDIASFGDAGISSGIDGHSSGDIGSASGGDGMFSGNTGNESGDTGKDSEGTELTSDCPQQTAGGYVLPSKSPEVVCGGSEQVS